MCTVRICPVSIHTMNIDDMVEKKHIYSYYRQIVLRLPSESVRATMSTCQYGKILCIEIHGNAHLSHPSVYPYDDFVI